MSPSLADLVIGGANASWIWTAPISESSYNLDMPFNAEAMPAS